MNSLSLPSAKSGAQGFTLVELLVALVIFSFISVAVVTALYTFARSQEAVETKAETLEEMRLTLGFLQRTISQAQPLSHPSGDGFFFIGDNDRLEWVYPMSQAGVFGLQVMRLSMRDDDLVLQMQPFVRDAKTELDWSGAEAFVVIEQAKFEVAYKETWSSDWQQQWPLSRWGLYAVRLQLGKGEQHWPEMILRLGNIRQGRLAW